MQRIAELSQQLDMVELRLDHSLDYEVSTIGDRLSSELELAMATLFTDTSPLQLAHDLKWARMPGYEFFAVYAEQWKDDPAFAEAEQRLYELVAKPIHVADSARNRAELEGWRDMSSLYADGTPIGSDDLLERAQTVLACDNGEIAPEPTERIWATMAKSGKRRREMRGEASSAQRARGRVRSSRDRPHQSRRQRRKLAPGRGDRSRHRRGVRRDLDDARGRHPKPSAARRWAEPRVWLVRLNVLDHSPRLPRLGRVAAQQLKRDLGLSCLDHLVASSRINAEHEKRRIRNSIQLGPVRRFRPLDRVAGAIAGRPHARSERIPRPWR